MSKLSLYSILSEDNGSEVFLKSMRNTVNDQSASYPEAEKIKNSDMWLNMWAKDFVLDFTKNEISKNVPPGGEGYCRKGYIHTYDYKFNKQEVGIEREFQGKNSLYKQLLNIKNLNSNTSTPKLYICDSQLEMSKYKWDYKFNYEGQQIGWWQLLNLDWGVADRSKLQSAWNSARSYISSNKGEFCTENEMGVKCVSSVYNDPLTWFKDPHNLLTFLEITTVFIPIIGPALSVGFGLGNAALYLKEGKNKDAAISAFFAILPGLGAIGGKVVGKLASKELKELSEKLIKNGLSDVNNINKEFLEKNANKFTKEEFEVINNTIENKNLLISELKNLPIKDPKKLSVVLSKIKNKSLSSGVDMGVNVIGAGLGLTADKTMIPLYKKLNPGVREKIEKLGFSFKDVQSLFLSNKSEKDNTLLLSALNYGWIPGTKVPDKFQTDDYKLLTNDIETTFKLADFSDKEEWDKKMDSWEKELEINKDFK